FLGGVLEYMASDERLIAAFAAENNLDPADVDRGRLVLAGVWERDLPRPSAGIVLPTLWIRQSAVHAALHLVCCAIPRRHLSASPTSIATHFTPRSRNETIPRWPTNR